MEGQPPLCRDGCAPCISAFTKALHDLVTLFLTPFPLPWNKEELISWSQTPGSVNTIPPRRTAKLNWREAGTDDSVYQEACRRVSNKSRKNQQATMSKWNEQSVSTVRCADLTEEAKATAKHCLWRFTKLTDTFFNNQCHPGSPSKTQMPGINPWSRIIDSFPEVSIKPKYDETPLSDQLLPSRGFHLLCSAILSY